MNKKEKKIKALFLIIFFGLSLENRLLAIPTSGESELSVPGPDRFPQRSAWLLQVCFSEESWDKTWAGGDDCRDSSRVIRSHIGSFLEERDLEDLRCVAWVCSRKVSGASVWRSIPIESLLQPLEEEQDDSSELKEVIPQNPAPLNQIPRNRRSWTCLSVPVEPWRPRQNPPIEEAINPWTPRVRMRGEPEGTPNAAPNFRRFLGVLEEAHPSLSLRLPPSVEKKTRKRKVALSTEKTLQELRHFEQVGDHE